MVLPGESQKSLAWPKEKECRPEKIQRKKASQMQEPPKQRPCGSEEPKRVCRPGRLGCIRWAGGGAGGGGSPPIWTLVKAPTVILKNTKLEKRYKQPGATTPFAPCRRSPLVLSGEHTGKGGLSLGDEGSPGR